MKKVFALLLITALLFTFTACSRGTDAPLETTESVGGAATMDLQPNRDNTESSQLSPGDMIKPVMPNDDGTAPEGAPGADGAAGAGGTGNTAAGEPAYTLDDAVNIALTEAGVAAADATFTEQALEYDDGMQVYQIDFVAGELEYEFEISAETGAVLEFSSESIYD